MQYIVTRDVSHPNGDATVNNYFIPSKKNTKKDDEIAVEETPEDRKIRKESEKMEKKLKKELKASKKERKNV